MNRVCRFSYLIIYLKALGLYLPSFYMSYGHKKTIKNVWNHSRKWGRTK